MQNIHNYSSAIKSSNRFNGMIHGPGEIESLQNEIALIHEIAHSDSLEEVLNVILIALNKKYGFNMSAGQIVDEENNILRFLSFFTKDEVDEETRRLVSVDVPLEAKYSVSATVALTKRWVYADSDSIESMDDIPEIDRNSLELLNIRENLILPIIDGNKTIAVIHLGAIDKRLDLSKNTCEEIYRFIGSLAPNVQIIKNKFEQEHIKQEQQKALDIIHRISRTIKLDEILQILGEEINNLEGVDGYSINLLDKEKKHLTCNKVALPGEFKAIEKTFHHFNYTLGPTDENTLVIENKKVISIHHGNKENFSESTRSRFKAWKMHHMVSLPLTNIEDDSAKVIGAIMLFNNSEMISRKSIDTLCKKLSMFFDPIDNSLKYSDLKQKEQIVESGIAERAQFLSFVNEVNNLNSVDKIYEKISDEFLSRYPFDMVVILMEKDESLQGVSSYTKDEQYKQKARKWSEIIKYRPFDISYDGGSYSMCYLNNQNLYFPDVPQIMDLPMNRNDRIMLQQLDGLKSIIHLPINKDGKPIGVISISSFNTHVSLARDDINFLELLASFIGTAIINAGLYSTIAEQKGEIENTLSELKTTQEKLVDTERKKNDALMIAMQAAEASAEAKSTFLANMSHEIRTPMNAIIGLTELALHRDMSSKLRDYLGKINTSSQNLLGIINDILDFSKIEAGKLNIEETEFNIYEVIDHISDIFSTRIVEKNISMIINPSSKLPGQLIGDPLRLSQVLINIINNAIKFTNDGEIQVTIDLAKMENGSVVLSFMVSDTGIGITPEILSKLFTPFTQADSSTTRKFGGTGLGLSICKHLVTLMNGEINVTSEVGKGSKFAFTVEMKTSDVNCIGLYNSLDLIPEKILEKRILLAATNKHEASYLKETLKNHGIHADSIDSYASLMYQISIQDDYDLILVDADMLDQAFSKRMAELRSSCDSKIILLSPFGYDNNIKQDHLKDIAHIITKPIKISDLLNSVCTNLLSQSEYKPIYKSSVNDEKAYDDLEIIEKVRGMRILLTDDNKINQQVGREMLERVGAVVDIAEDGRQAIAKTLQNRYDIVFMDIHMPEIGGVEATKILRSMPATQDSVIIAMTANAMQGDREACISNGMDDYISKPIKSKDLYELLFKWDRRAPAVQEQIATVQNISTDKNINHLESLQAIDVANTLDMLAGNESLFNEICHLFKNDYGDSIEKLKDYLHQKDYGLAHRLCHSLKGIAATISADRFQEASFNLEQAISKENFEQIENLQPILETEFDKFLSDINILVS